jgi:tRNA threonylcarbamoyladenosine biosynthesis protein TsaE
MSTPHLELTLTDAAATEALGANIALTLVRSLAATRSASSVATRTQPLTIFLQGELGAGKTTLAQGLLRALAVTGTIRSPSYTLVEPYDTSLGLILHADLYRLTNARDIEALDLFDAGASAQVLLVEWPERAQELLPAPDLRVLLLHTATGRRAAVQALSSAISLDISKSGVQAMGAARRAKL